MFNRLVDAWGVCMCELLGLRVCSQGGQTQPQLTSNRHGHRTSTPRTHETKAEVAVSPADMTAPSSNTVLQADVLGPTRMIPAVNRCLCLLRPVNPAPPPFWCWVPPRKAFAVTPACYRSATWVLCCRSSWCCDRRLCVFCLCWTEVVYHFLWSTPSECLPHV